MKIYLAAPYPMRTDAVSLMHHLESQGHIVTSRWLREPMANDAVSAQMDLDDVTAADLLLLINPPAWANAGTGGRHTEVGYALALGKAVVVLGVQSNVFHELAQVRVIERIEEL